MAGAPVDLGGGVWQFQTSLWQTNALLAVAGGEALVCDPNWSPEEIEGIRAAAEERGVQVAHVLITHGDYDHTCGIGFFPEARIVCCETTAAVIRSGAATAALESAGPEWGVEWPTVLRADDVLSCGEPTLLGGFRVAAIDARGHVGDGCAFVLLEQGVLLPGDYLSEMTYPFATSSIAAARETCERLLAALDLHELRWVVPGHGRALTPAEAREVGTADLAYLETVERTARDAVAEGLPPGHALVAVYAVEPPRPTTDDFDVFALRTVNAKTALAEAVA